MLTSSHFPALSRCQTSSSTSIQKQCEPSPGMPAYFYHLSIEVLRSSQSSSPTVSSLALESACEALLPFQKPSRPPSSRPSSGAGSSTSTPPSRTQGTQFTLEHRPKHSPTSSNETPPSRHTLPQDPTSISTSNLRTKTDLSNDIRAGAIVIECIDMVAPDHHAPGKRTSKRGSNAHPTTTTTEDDNLVAAGIGTDILGGLRTKGRYTPLDQKGCDSVYGIVHLYRDAQETPHLAGNEDDYPTYLKGSAAAARQPVDQASSLQLQAPSSLAGGGSGKQTRARGADLAAYPFPVTASSSAVEGEDECTTLCILAVPSYLSPSDFLGFVGEKSMDCVSHFRMIRTPRANRYMVLMKFRSGRRAREWQKEWNGKVFNSMEVCWSSSWKWGVLVSLTCSSLRRATSSSSNLSRFKSSSLALHPPFHLVTHPPAKQHSQANPSHHQRQL